jgi:fumarylacetoacetase
MMQIEANDPALRSWVDGADNSPFPVQNLPLGLMRISDQETRVVSAIGNKVINLLELFRTGLLDGLSLNEETLAADALNPLLALGKPALRDLRHRLSLIMRDTADENTKEKATQALKPIQDARLILPIKIGDYTDFYSSREHATNVGSMFRDPDNALLPNWLHIPVGYHGRASSIVVSGTDIRRPKGQQLPQGADKPVFGPSKLLDFELEMGFVICRENPLGTPIPIEETEDYIAGFMLFNDWSARDIQKWEYVPLGPFLAKNFASTVSPWIIMLDALEPFRVEGPEQEPEVLPYLQFSGEKNYDIKLEVAIRTEGGQEKVVTHSNFKYMYWNMCQQLAHHTVNGCNIRVGDIYASGTISGPDTASYGSMLELTWKGSKPINMPDGSERKFILDGDTVIMRGFAEKDGVRIGFGEAAGKVLPAL